MDSAFRFYVGVDWAKDDYDVTVLGPDGGIVARRKVAHNGKAMIEFAAWLIALCQQRPEVVGVTIEMTRGALVELLLDHGFAVFSINPKQMDRFRDRHSVAGAKDDPLDSLVGADALRTDQRLFHRLSLQEAAFIRLRELSRLDGSIQGDLNRVLNQVSEQFHRYYPQLLSLCPAADEGWLWELWKLAPQPAQGAKLTASRLEKLLKRHRIRKYTAKQVMEALRTAPLPVAAGVAEAAAEQVSMLLPRVQLLHEQRKQLHRRLEGMLKELSQPIQSGEPASANQPPEDSAQDCCGQAEQPKQTEQHRDAAILLSLPGVGTIIGATMLAEAHQALQQRDYHALRAYCGTAPVTRRSGRRRAVLMRRSCNVRLRNALYHWARVSIIQDDRSYDHYSKLRAAGHGHNRALRGLADRWLAVLIAMLKSGTLFDPERWQPTRPALN